MVPVDGSIDLGPVSCVGGAIGVDRVTDVSPAPGSAGAIGGVVFYLARPPDAPGFGEGSAGEPRDLMRPATPCP